MHAHGRALAQARCLLQRSRPRCRAAAAGRAASAAAAGAAAPPPSRLPFTLRDLDVYVGDWGAVRLVVPASEDEVLDHYIASGKGDADPFFCSIWPSSICLALNLLKQPKLVAGKRAIDVGCGLGLAGIAAALAGASNVVLADRELFALRCSLLAAQANGLFPTPLAGDEDAGDASDNERRLRSLMAPASGAAAGLGAVSALQLDWHAPPAALRGAFDVMTCADVLYDGSAAEPVAALALHLLAPGGTLLLADPPARTPAHRARFLAALEGTPLALASEEQQSVFDADGKPADIRLLRFQRGG